MNSHARVDFFVVGAQKSGTTSLFHHLAAHPQVFMTPQKETEFFYRSDYYALGVPWYLSEYFSKAPSGVKTGEASPQYMCHPEVAKRIAAAFPAAKLVMILRDPIERAISHYRMAVRRGLMSMSLSDAIEEAFDLIGADYSHDVAYRDFVRFGEYGTVLNWYLNSFDKDQIHVMFLDEFEADPSKSMRFLYEFLKVDANKAPLDATKKFHVGGEKRFPRLERWLRRQENVKRLVRTMLGTDTYNRLHFWFEVEGNVRKKAPNLELRPAVRSRLVEHYLADAERLATLLDREPTWASSWLHAKTTAESMRNCA